MAPSSPQTSRSGAGQGVGTAYVPQAGRWAWLTLLVQLALKALVSVHAGRRRCQQANRVWDPVPIRATFLGCSVPAAGAPDSSLPWGLRWIDQTLLSVLGL